MLDIDRHTLELVLMLEEWLLRKKTYIELILQRFVRAIAFPSLRSSGVG